MGMGRLGWVGLLVAACAVDSRTLTTEAPFDAPADRDSINPALQAPGDNVAQATGLEASNEMEPAGDQNAAPPSSNESAAGSANISPPAVSPSAASDGNAPVEPDAEDESGESSESDPGPLPDDGEPPRPPPASSPDPPSMPLPPELLANGAVCTQGDECASNLCSDSRCCQAQCVSCQSCLGPSGTCVPVTDAVDADSCAAPLLCGAGASCLTIDQVQTLTDFNVALAGVGVSRFAQLVLPARSGALSEMVLGVFCFSGSATLELQGVADGQPDGVVAYGDTFVPEATSDTTRIVIEPPLPIRAGFPFAIVLDAAPGAVSCSATSADGDVYTRGDSFIEDPRAPGEWFSYPGDMRFETRVAQ
jgi:hypothetical protein